MAELYMRLTIEASQEQGQQNVEYDSVTKQSTDTNPEPISFSE